MRRMLLPALITLLAPLAASAQPIDPVNVRPTPVNPSAPTGERSLSDILNGAGGGALFPPYNFDVFNADNGSNNGQSRNGVWGSSSPSSATTIPTLVVEYAGFANINKFGIWFGSDRSSIAAYDLLLGGASAGSFAAIQVGYGTLSVVGFGCGVVVACTSPTGVNDARIDPTRFGFYFQTGNGARVYSVDAMNSGGEPRFLAFRAGPTTNWAFAYEDLPLAQSDRDYNDMIVKVESIVAVPEPGTWILMACGLALVLLRTRRRE